MVPHFIAATLQNLKMLIMTYTFLSKEANVYKTLTPYPASLLTHLPVILTIPRCSLFVGMSRTNGGDDKVYTT